MNLVVDVGNTTVKVAVYKEHTMLLKKRFLIIDFLKNITVIFKEFQSINQAIISSVANFSKEHIDALMYFCPVYQVTSKTKVPFVNSYNSKKTLGTDRLALVTAAFYKYPKKNILIISAGTCVTYDFLDEKEVYQGGAISPGLAMRYKALHEYTARLPLLEINSVQNFIGKTTEESIHSGVVNGMVKEIEGIIIDYNHLYKDLTIILTGGDALFLSKQLKNSIFANPNFLLEGLNYILEYNKQ